MLQLKLLYFIAMGWLLNVMPLESTSYQLHDILFLNNSDKLSEQQIAQLKQNVSIIRKWMKEEKIVAFTLVINGNADKSEKGIKQLAKRRALIVKEQLIKLGLTNGKLIIKNNEYCHPLTEHLDEKWVNMRVDFQIINAKNSIPKKDKTLKSILYAYKFL